MIANVVQGSGVGSAPPAPTHQEPVITEAPKYRPPDHLEVRLERPRAQAPAAVQKPAAEEEKPKEALDADDFKRLIEEVNDRVQRQGHRLSFGVYEGTREFYAKLIALQTNEVVRLIPSEEVLRFHQKLDETVGLIVDEKA